MEATEGCDFQVLGVFHKNSYVDLGIDTCDTLSFHLLGSGSLGDERDVTQCFSSCYEGDIQESWHFAGDQGQLSLRVPSQHSIPPCCSKENLVKRMHCYGL